MSQASDFLSSSFHGGDDLGYPFSDDIPQLITETSFSQQSFSSIPDSEFIQPLLIPPSLQCVGPDRNKSWVLYSNMNKTDFIEWWLQTEFGSKGDDKKKMNWAGSGTHSDVWNYFDPVAHFSSGQPKVLCQRCGKLLDHPSYTSNGTKSMNRHWKSENCQRHANSVSKQTTLGQLM